MNFLKRGTDFLSSKKELLTEELHNKTSGLTEQINGIGTNAANLGEKIGSQPSNVGQQGIGDFRGKFDNVAEQVKQKGDSIITQAKGVAVGSVPAPVVNGVQNLGFSIESEENLGPNGNETSVVAGGENGNKTSDRDSERKLNAGSSSINVAPGLSLSEINNNYINNKHREQRLGDNLHNKENAQTPEEISVKNDFGVSVLVNQRPVQSPPNIGYRNVNISRHNSNPSNFYGRADKGQVIYYVTENGQPIAVKRIQRSKSHYMGMAGRNPSYYAQWPGQNRMFYKSFSRPTMAQTSHNSKGKRDQVITSSTKIRKTSDKQLPFDHQDLGKISISAGNLKDHTASLNPISPSHLKQQEGTIDNLYGTADEYKAQVSDIMKQGSDLQNGLSKEKLIERAKDLRSSYIDSKFGQIEAIPTGIFGNTNTNGTNPDVSEPKSQSSAFPLTSNISGITKAPQETFEHVRNNLDPENLKQKAFGSFNLWPGPQSATENKAGTTSPPSGKQSGNVGLPVSLDGKITEGKEKLAALKDKFGIFGKSKGKDSNQTDAVNKPPGGADKTDTTNISNSKQIGVSGLPQSVDSKLSEGKEKLTGLKNNFGFFGKSKGKDSDQVDSMNKSSVGADKKDTTSPSDGKQIGVLGFPQSVDSKLSEGKEKLTAFKNNFGIFGKSNDKDSDQTDALNKPSGSDGKPDTANPSNGKQIGVPGLPGSVDSKLSEGKEKLTAFKDKFGIFGKLDQTGAVDQPSGGGDETGNNGLNGVMGKFSGFGLPFGGKEENVTDKLKNPGNIEKGVFIARFEDTRGPSCNYTVGVIVRLTLVIINALTIVRTITVTKNHWNWGCAPVCAIFMALEYSQVVFRRLGREWTWWVPCLLVYLVTTLPLIWQLQMNNMGTDNGVPKKTDVWTIVASDALVYLTIFARWLLQGGVVTFGSLASVIMDFIANASDIMDLLSLSDQPEVRASNMLMYWVLGAWSASFIKFIPLIDIDGKSKDPKRLPKCIIVHFGPLFTEALQIIFTLVLLDGSFLVIRTYLLVGEGVVTFSLVFFIVKNMLSLGVQVRRLVIICKSMPWNQKQEDDEAKQEYDTA